MEFVAILQKFAVADSMGGCCGGPDCKRTKKDARLCCNYANVEGVVHFHQGIVMLQYNGTKNYFEKSALYCVIHKILIP